MYVERLESATEDGVGASEGGIDVVRILIVEAIASAVIECMGSAA